MSSLLSGAIVVTLGCYAVASILVVARLIRGPRAQDRVLALDLLYVHGLLFMLVLNIRYARDTYFEGALIIALLSFVSSSGMAKFILRGEVIE
jgi:multicomponent K+:H+ antiporter subunit F